MDRHIRTVSRTVTISDLTPEELASLFSQWSCTQQAAFFHALHCEAVAWFEGGSWGGQAFSAVSKMSPEAREVLQAFADCLGSDQ